MFALKSVCDLNAFALNRRKKATVAFAKLRGRTKLIAIDCRRSAVSNRKPIYCEYVIFVSQNQREKLRFIFKSIQTRGLFFYYDNLTTQTDNYF